MGLLIDPTSKVFGLDLKTARKFVIRLRKYASIYNSDDFHYYTFVRSIGEIVFPKEKQRVGSGYSLSELNPNAIAVAPGLLQSMIDEGYLTTIESPFPHSDYPWYQVTTKGAELSRHKLIKRLARAKAEKKLKEFLDRVDLWNASEPYAWVQNVWLYGSLITSAPDVGDIDLVCEYKTNPDSPDAMTDTGYYDFEEVVGGSKGHDIVKKFLRKGCPYLSLDGFKPRHLPLIQGGYIQIVKERQVVYQPNVVTPATSVSLDKRDKAAMGQAV